MDTLEDYVQIDYLTAYNIAHGNTGRSEEIEVHRNVGYIQGDN